MSTMNFQCVSTLTLTAGENLATDLYTILTRDASGRVVKTTAATDVPVGVLAMNTNQAQGKPGDSTDSGVLVAQLQGVVMVKCGGAIAAGNLVQAGAAGVAVDAGGSGLADLGVGEFAIGVALEAGVTNQVIPVLAMLVASNS